MVVIEVYKGYEIEYKDEQFFAKANINGKEEVFTSSNERSVKAQVDNADSIRIEKQKAEEERKAKEKLLENWKGVALKLNFADFKFYIRACAEMLSEIEMTLVQESKNKVMITTSQLDPANVMKIVYQIPAKGTIGKIKELKLSVQAGTIKNIVNSIKGVKNNAELNISFMPKGEQIEMIISNGFGVYGVNINLEHYSTSVKGLSLKSPFKITLDTKELVDTIRMADKVAESIRFEFNEGILKLITNQDGNNYSRLLTGKVKYKKGSEKVIDCISKYSIEYLKRIRITSKQVYISFMKDYPVTITDERGNYYVLAPRVEGL